MPPLMPMVRAKLRHLIYGLPPYDPAAEHAVTPPLECGLSRMADFDEPWCKRHMQIICGPHTRFRSLVHRKYWEIASCMQALEERGMLVPGKTGLVFGVGREPLPSIFAARGCRIIATDQAPEGAEDWTATGQHASALDQLWRREYVSKEDFHQRVSFRAVDMNQIPEDLHDTADFVWSLCSLEHLGSLENGIRFVVDSLRCIKPGGWGVYTAEFNVSDEVRTIEAANLCAFRRSDIEELVRRVEEAGGTVLPRDYSIGGHAYDWYISAPPYPPRKPGLKVRLGEFVLTCIRLIIQRRA
jgi:hypothetical protein